MIQALGFSESLLGSFKSARKLLEGFDTSDGQALPAFASPFWVRPRPRAELAGVAEEVRSDYRQSWESLVCGLLSTLILFSSLPSLPSLPLFLPTLFGPNHCVPVWDNESLLAFSSSLCVKVVCILLPAH